MNLKVVSGFRTMAEQTYFYNCHVNCNCNNCNLAAKPGYSNHQSGHALDLNTVNLVLLLLAIVLHWTPGRFLKACQQGGGFVASAARIRDHAGQRGVAKVAKHFIVVNANDGDLVRH